jgi:hypothetical protein
MPRAPLIFVGGMLALALAVASLALQARAAGAFGTGMTIFSLVMAGITVFSFQFFPVLARRFPARLILAWSSVEYGCCRRMARSPPAWPECFLMR